MCKECEEIIARRGFIKNTPVIAAAVSGLLSSGELFAGVNELQDDEQAGDHIVSVDVEFNHGSVHTIKGFLSRPKRDGMFKPIIISHGFGETDYLKYTATRLALSGYAAFVFLEQSAQKIKTTKAKQSKKINVLDAVISYLYAQEFIHSQGVGLLGFCAAGREYMVQATENPEVKAVVSIYGKVTDQGGKSPIDVVEKIKIPIQAHFGKKDVVVPLENAKTFSSLLKQHNPKASTFLYDSVGHSYCNFSIPEGTNPGFDYNYHAAMKTYQRSIDFFKAHF